MNPRNNFTVLLALFGWFLTHANAENRIIGGRPSQIESTRHSVAIFYLNFEFINYSCAGSLVSWKFVVTASICIGYPHLYRVVAGLTRLMDAKAGLGQRSVVLSKYRRGDIIVIELETTFHETDQVRLIPLCNSPLEPGDTIHISGWGSTTGRSTNPYNRLKSKSVQILTTQQCGAANRRNPEYMPETSMCAGCGENMGHGDYGAAGVVDGRLCAVAQLWYIRDKEPDLYTNVSIKEIQDFIIWTINNN